MLRGGVYTKFADGAKGEEAGNSKKAGSKEFCADTGRVLTS
jgi:hypothetical protein